MNVVYTCITKGYDVIKEPRVCKRSNEDIKYICFTDDKDLTSSLWEIRYIPNLYHKLPKILPHKYLKEYDNSLWIDGSVILKEDPIELFKLLKDKNIYTFNAKCWHCAYKEAKVCTNLGYNYDNIISKQVKFLEEEKYPKENGLSACSVILRRHNKKSIKELSELWYKQITQFSSRDQISFNYCLWKLNIEQGFIPGSVYKNEYLKWSPH